jgi:secreted trypsin-like serine protease
MGIISFGAPVCGTPDAPTVFTKIGYYTNWIEQILEEVSFFLSCRVRDRTKELRPSLSSMDVVKATKGLTAIPPERLQLDGAELTTCHVCSISHS